MNLWDEAYHKDYLMSLKDNWILSVLSNIKCYYMLFCFSYMMNVNLQL